MTRFRTLALGLCATALTTVSPLAAQAVSPPSVSTGESGLSVDVTDESGDDLVIAVPALATPQAVATPAGSTEALGRQVAEVITADLRNSGLFRPKGPDSVRGITFGEVTAPAYTYWRGASSEALVQGFVRAKGDGKLTVGCYLYDVALGTELTRQGFDIAPGDWRRAAHKCADAIYARLSGESPFFDSRIAYIAESGPKDNRVKRLAIMDSDGANHRFITNGQSIALTPRFSPDYKQIVYLSYIGKRPRIYIYDIGTGKQKLVTESVNQTFSPRFSPDGRFILYSMSVSGNTDIYRVSAAGGGTPQRLTNSPGIDTGGSYSPDGSKIVFESDRGGSQQIYVMNADGSGQQRISFGGGRSATPEWSPRGDLIAFTKIGGGFRVGVMSPTGGGERLLTNGWQDEAPSWSPNGRVIQFFRSSPGRSGKSAVWQVDLTGRNERKIPTPLDGSDPAWGPLLP
ncbi:TolB protein [Sphingobium boeckii]|uniref:Tol-Pal system protein TolB n=2 Tax=Sphingobium boeckii TaxID=1082345 RepID=A0A7W9AKZ0_9SPHN|nr:Tol-Pal system beta propeller repeat protein TolB [Sphingobium boeckii]MBB5687585.1 TolB protein [Sphingobium boeckii]